MRKFGVSRLVPTRNVNFVDSGTMGPIRSFARAHGSRSANGPIIIEFLEKNSPRFEYDFKSGFNAIFTMNLNMIFNVGFNMIFSVYFNIVFYVGFDMLLYVGINVIFSVGFNVISMSGCT